MQTQKMDRTVLREQINAHPLLALPPQDRPAQARLRMELIELLLRYLKFDQQLERTLQTDDSALLQNEESLHRAQYEPSVRGRQFDGVAFMEAANEAIRRYDEASGTPFLGYFSLLYRQKLLHAAGASIPVQEQRAFGPLKKRDMALLRKLNALLQRKNSRYRAEDLPPALCAQLVAELGVTESALRELLRVVRMANTIAPKSSEEDDEPAELPCPDPESTDFVGALETVQQLADALDMLCETEQKEYTRLFMTNDVLRPLKEDEIVDDIGYARVLVQHEQALFEGVFVRPYLGFVYEPTPAPDTMRGVILGKLRLPLRDSSIASYKQVYASAVSMARQRFEKLRMKLRGHLQAAAEAPPGAAR